MKNNSGSSSSAQDQSGFRLGESSAAFDSCHSRGLEGKTWVHKKVFSEENKAMVQPQTSPYSLTVWHGCSRYAVVSAAHRVVILHPGGRSDARGR